MLESNENNRSLDIYHYLDFRQFLADWYTLKKRLDYRFSYNKWALMAGFKSRSFIRLVISAHRKLTDESARKILSTLDLEAGQHKYFMALVNFNLAADLPSREKYWKLVLETRNVKKDNLELDTYYFLSSHYCPKLQLLIKLENIDRTTAALASYLGLTSFQTEKYLNILKSMGIAKFSDQDLCWHSTVEDFRVESQQVDYAIQSFHKKSLEYAISSIQKPKDSRFYNSLIINLSPDNYTKINQEINEFLLLLQHRYQSAGNSQEKLYQINMSNIPISKNFKNIENIENIENITAASDLNDNE